MWLIRATERRWASWLFRVEPGRFPNQLSTYESEYLLARRAQAIRDENADQLVVVIQGVYSCG